MSSASVSRGLRGGRGARADRLEAERARVVDGLGLPGDVIQQGGGEVHAAHDAGEDDAEVEGAEGDAGVLRFLGRWVGSEDGEAFEAGADEAFYDADEHLGRGRFCRLSFGGGFPWLCGGVGRVVGGRVVHVTYHERTARSCQVFSIPGCGVGRWGGFPGLSGEYAGWAIPVTVPPAAG